MTDPMYTVYKKTYTNYLWKLCFTIHTLPNLAVPNYLDHLLAERATIYFAGIRTFLVQFLILKATEFFIGSLAFHNLVKPILSKSEYTF